MILDEVHVISRVIKALCKATILDSIKWNNYPPSPKVMMKARRSKKMRHFDIIEMGGGVVQMFHLFCPRLYAGFQRDKTK